MSTLPLFGSQPDADGGPGAPSETVFRVGQLNRLVRLQLEDRFRNIWVQGELADVSRPASGHIYFSLNDEEENAQVRGVIFRSDAVRAKARLENGARVKLRGTLSLFEPRGSYQFIARIALPFGLGDLHAQFEAVRKRLESDGLLDAARKRSLPRVPELVGVVTSVSGAALHDIVAVAQQRCPTRIVVAPCVVQGHEAPASIIAALTAIQRLPGLSVVIVGRGGGASEDLQAFNDERVARAVAACRVPTISAVGHEVDVSITDLVADVRAATPSNAAELAVPAREALLAELSRLEQRLRHEVRMALSRRRLELDRSAGRLRDPSLLLSQARRQQERLETRLADALRGRVQRRGRRLEQLQARLAQYNPALRTAQRRSRLQQLQTRLHAAVEQRCRFERGRLAQSAARLSALSPLSVLARGYAIALHEPSGRALLHAHDAKPGDRVELRLHDGRLLTKVEP